MVQHSENCACANTLRVLVASVLNGGKPPTPNQTDRDPFPIVSDFWLRGDYRSAR
jgi:hypothetical protein